MFNNSDLSTNNIILSANTYRTTRNSSNINKKEANKIVDEAKEKGWNHNFPTTSHVLETVKNLNKTNEERETLIDNLIYEKEELEELLRKERLNLNKLRKQYRNLYEKETTNSLSTLSNIGFMTKLSENNQQLTNENLSLKNENKRLRTIIEWKNEI